MEASKLAERRICARQRVESTFGEGREGLLSRFGLGTRFRVKVIDLSETGMKVVACHPLPVAARYGFVLDGGKRGNLWAPGRVVWSEEVQQGKGDTTLHGFLAGVEFVHTRTKHRSFLRELADRRKPRETKWKH
ncbi:MAG: PilZ domain-containing protein [Planctomycetes bacterium]|nr:PilZ domain-containing protein [Planctomycetota bacterium]